MAFEMLEVGPSLAGARIDALERDLGIVLPQEYRAFLSQYNGGRPDPGFFPIRGLDLNPFGAIQIFLGLSASIQSSNIEWAYRRYLRRNAG